MESLTFTLERLTQHGGKQHFQYNWVNLVYISSAVDLTPSAYLASTAASLDLVHHVVPARLQGLPLPNASDAFARWSRGHDCAPPEEGEQHSQKASVDPRASALAESLLEMAPELRAHARLLASTAKESGAWLNILPILTLELHMDDNTIRVATGLRLGAPLCRPLFCIHCGEAVDSLATHGLCCQWSDRRLPSQTC